MGGDKPHLGMIITQGYVSGYNISGKSTSNERGVISLNFSSIKLSAGGSQTIKWHLFWNKSWTDFYKQAKELGWVRGSANYYTLEEGEKAEITFEGNSLRHAVCILTGSLFLPIFVTIKLS